MIEQWILASIRNRWLVLLLAMIMGGLGIYSFTRMNLDAYPDISGVQVQLITAYPGRAAEEVEQQITVPLERTMASVPRIEVIRSRTIFGLSVLQIIFEPDVEDYWAREVVFQKIGEAGLPSDAQPSLGTLSTAYGEIYRYELVSTRGHSVLELRTLNDWVITPRLLRAKGVVDVSNFGGLGKQYTVRVDREKLLRLRVSLQDVLNAIKTNNSSGGGSLIERGSTSLVIRGLGRVLESKELAEILVKNSNGTPVYVKDVAEIEIDHLPQTGIFGKNKDAEGVEGIVRMRRGENPSVVLKYIDHAVNELNHSGKLPEGVSIKPFYNRTELIDETFKTVIHNTLFGIALVVITLVIFLGDIKVALIVALTIPGSLMFALILMKLTNIPLSLLSIGAIDFGIIVDGAVIVSENIIRCLKEREEAPQGSRLAQQGVDSTIYQATCQIQRPMLFSMLIVMVAYLPLLSLKYIEGLLFKPMAITLCYAFGGALLMALFLVPTLSSFFFKNGKPPHETKIFDIILKAYEKWLAFCAKKAKLVVSVAAGAAILIAVLIVPKLGTEFLPYMDEGVFWLRVNFPEGVSLKENAYYSTELRKLLMEFQEVSMVTTQAGRNDTGNDPFPTNRTEILVGLKPRSEWKNFSTKMEIEAAIQAKLVASFPTIRLNLTQPIIDSVTEDTNGTSANLAIEIIGPDLAELRKIAGKSVRLLKQIPGNRNVNIEQEGPQPQLQIRLDRRRLAQYQLSADSVNEIINTAVGGAPVSYLFESERKFDVLVKYKKEQVSSPSMIGVLPIFNEAKEAIPLAQVADIRVLEGETLIARSNAQRRVTVRADIRDRAQGEFVREAQEKFKREIILPHGYSVEWKGLFENLERAEKHFGVLIPLTIAIILGILILNFKSLLNASLVIMTIPFALMGSMVALWVRGMHLTVSAGVGFTSLFGVAAMHGVLLISTFLQLRKEGKYNFQDTIFEAAKLRLRPVIMTGVVAILGLLPASLATGIGSDVQKPIATVIVWGLFSSASMTLLVLPCILLLLEKPFAKKKISG